jgi:UDP-GlcNAc:undecaprenyl-phosphate GlcNAc-1-phosphate transferase
MGILPSFYTPQHPVHLAIVKPLLILGIILGDLACVVWIRMRLGRPIYVGDTNHLSHRLVRRGWSPTRAVLVIWLSAAALGWICFALL